LLEVTANLLDPVVVMFGLAPVVPVFTGLGGGDHVGGPVLDDGDVQAAGIIPGIAAGMAATRIRLRLAQGMSQRLSLFSGTVHATYSM
jgi:hypothetical protein